MTTDQTGGDINETTRIEMATERDLSKLPSNTAEILKGRIIIAIIHKGYVGAYSVEGEHDMIKPTDLHTYQIQTADGRTVYSSVNYKNPRLERINAMMSRHTGMLAPKMEEWVYDYDGKDVVEITFPDGKKQEIKLDEETTLESVLKVIRDSMPKKNPDILEERKFAAKAN